MIIDIDIGKAAPRLIQEEERRDKYSNIPLESSRLGRSAAEMNTARASICSSTARLSVCLPPTRPMATIVVLLPAELGEIGGLRNC